MVKAVINMDKDYNNFENKWFFEEYYDAHLY